MKRYLTLMISYLPQKLIVADLTLVYTMGAANSRTAVTFVNVQQSTKVETVKVHIP